MERPAQDSIRELVKLWMMLVRDFDGGCAVRIEKSESDDRLSGDWRGWRGYYATPEIVDQFNELCHRLTHGDYLPNMLQEKLNELAARAQVLMFFVTYGSVWDEPSSIDQLFFQKDGLFLSHKPLAGHIGPYLKRINQLQHAILKDQPKDGSADGDDTATRKGKRSGRKPDPDIQARNAYVRQLRSQGTKAYLDIATALLKAESFQNDPWLERWKDELDDPDFNWRKAATHSKTKNYFKNKICNPKPS
jgi:hypothetical protein